MSSKITICSNALLQLGKKPIATFDEGNDRALLCSNFYPDVRDATLRIHPWNCATKRLPLAPSTTEPVYEFDFAFDMPAEMLRFLEADTAAGWKIEGQQILANENPLYVKYIFRNENVPSYDALLIEVLTAAMAVKMAYPLTKSTSEVQAAQALYKFWFDQAKGVDGQEDTPDQLSAPSLTRVRRSGGGSSIG